MILFADVNALQCRMMLRVGGVVAYSLPTLAHIKAVRSLPFSLIYQYCMGDDSTASHVRTTCVSMTFSPPDYRGAGSAA